MPLNLGVGALLRAAILAFAAVLLLAVGYVAILWNPEPFFAYRVTQGNLMLASDRPFEPEEGRRLLARVQSRLETSPLYDPERPMRAFICNDPWRYRFFFNRSAGAAGVCMVPIPAVFLRSADVLSNRLYDPKGEPVPPPRDLAYYLAHEMVHDLTGARLGIAGHYRLPRWVREGLADYVGRAETFDMAEALAAYREGKPEMDPRRSGRYDRYMLRVAYCLEVAGMSLDALLTDPPDAATVEAGLDAIAPSATPPGAEPAKEG